MKRALKNGNIDVFIKYFLILIIICLLQQNSYSQRELENYYFVDSNSIHFKDCNEFLRYKTCNTYSKEYSQINFKSTYFHFLAINDSLGKIKLYTDGYNIWNKKNVIMQNGDINKTSELISSFFFLPVPEQQNKYYLFNYYFSYLNYSVIDMNYNNGEGKVLSKKKILNLDNTSYTNINPITHYNGKDLWLIAEDSLGNFATYYFDKDGILNTNINKKNFLPVIFKNKYKLKGNRYFNCVSPYGDKVVLYNGGCFNYDSLTKEITNLIVICKFDKRIGTLYSPITINVNKLTVTQFVFSPDGSKLYNEEGLVQYDLAVWDSTAIEKSKVEINKDVKFIIESPLDDFVLIDDNKINNIFFDRVSLLKNPNNIASKTNYIKDYKIFPKKILNINFNLRSRHFHGFFNHFINLNKKICEIGKLELEVNAFVPKNINDNNNITFEWKGPENFFSLLRKPIIDSVTPKNSGWYYLTLFTPEDTLRDSLYIDIPIKNYIKITTNKTLPCQGDTVTLAIDTTYKNIYWNTGDSTKSIKVTKPGKYTVMIEDENCCNSFDEIEVVYATPPNPEIEIIGNNPSCFGDTVIIKPKYNYPVILWDDGDTNRIRKITKTTAYELTVIDSNGCSAKSTIEIKFANKPKPSITGDTKICLGTISTYEITTNKITKKDITISGGTIKSRTENEMKILWDKVGDYLVEIIETDTINGCIGKTSLNITVDSLKKPTIRQDIPLCYGSIGKLSVLETYDTYLWSTGEKTQSIFVTKSGTYKVVCTLSGGCSDSSEITVTEVPKPKIEIISDKGNTICQKGEKITLSVNPNDPEYSYFWSTGLITPSITVSDSGTYYLFAVNKYGCADTAIYRINIAPEFTPEITANKFKICKGEELELSANPNQTDYKYLWSNGLTSSKITIKDPGTYKVKVSNQFGCTKEIEQKIGQNPSISIQLDTSRAQIGNSTEITMTIFCESKIQLNNIEIKLIIDGSSLIITEEQKYLTYNYLPNQNLELILKIDSIDFSKNNINQFKIRGNTLLANNLNNPIIIDNVSLKADEFCIEKIPGALILEKICTFDLRKVKLIEEFNFEILPIPASDYIEVTYTSNNNEQSIIKYDIYNIYGENILCSSSHFNNNSNNIKSKIDISTLPTGVYFIKIGDKFEKFIKL